MEVKMTITTTAVQQPLTEYEAFVAAVVANPDDIGPRLMLADWLEEHGDHVGAAFHRQEFPSAPGAIQLATAVFLNWLGRCLALPVPDPGALRGADVGHEELPYDVAVYL